MTILNTLFRDENGFVVSAELVIVATIAVIAMAVGLSEISFSVNNELEDVGSAVGTVNQSFYANGIQSRGKGGTAGSGFVDRVDDCDSQFDVIPAGVQDEDYRVDDRYRYYRETAGWVSLDESAHAPLWSSPIDKELPLDFRRQLFFHRPDSATALKFSTLCAELRR